MFYRILTKNGVDNTNIDGARNYNFNAGRRSGIVKGALNQGNFFVSSSGSNVGNTVILDTCELRLCGHRVVIDEATYWSFHDLPQTPQRYSLIAQVIVDNSENVTFDLFLQSADTPLIQDNLDKTGTGTYQLEIGRYTQQTDGTITDVVRTADLITGGVGDDDAGEVINIGNVKTNTLDAGMEAEVDIENRYSEEEKKTYTDFTFSIPKGDQGIQGVQGEKGETGATGNGIISISKTGTSKLVDTYTISFTSGETTTFQVTNGKGITKIEKTATSGLVDTYTITFNDTTTSTFQVTNGAKGDKGEKGDTGVTPNITATATTLPAGSSATVTKSGTAENPAFAFGIPKGDKGDKGEKGEKGESGLIYQTTGQNTDGAMSQKATTDEFAKYLPLTGGDMSGALVMRKETPLRFRYASQNFTRYLIELYGYEDKNHNTSGIFFRSGSTNNSDINNTEITTERNKFRMIDDDGILYSGGDAYSNKVATMNNLTNYLRLTGGNLTGLVTTTSSFDILNSAGDTKLGSIGAFNNNYVGIDATSGIALGKNGYNKKWFIIIGDDGSLTFQQ